MYGSIMRARIKDGKREEFLQLMRDRARPDNNPGFHSGEVAFEDKDPNRIVFIIHFRDKQSYVANADAPNTDSEYREMVKYFESEPEWIDVNWGEYFGQPLSEKTATTA